MGGFHQLGITISSIRRHSTFNHYRLNRKDMEKEKNRVSGMDHTTYSRRLVFLRRLPGNSSEHTLYRHNRIRHI